MAIDKKILTRRSFLTGLGALVAGATVLGSSNANAEYRRGNPAIDRIISDEYEGREAEWAATDRMEQIPTPAPEAILNANGTLDLKMNGQGVISLEETKENPNPNALTGKYDIDDFIRAYGVDHWKCLTNETQIKTINLWENTVPDAQKNICEIYADPKGFFDRMFTPDKKAAFLKFNKGYNAVIQNGRTDKSVHPAIYMFKSENGSVTEDYARVHPWIDLSKPTIPDRMLIFLREYQPEVGFNNQRLRWDTIREYAR